MKIFPLLKGLLPSKITKPNANQTKMLSEDTFPVEQTAFNYNFKIIITSFDIRVYYICVKHSL